MGKDRRVILFFAFLIVIFSAFVVTDVRAVAPESCDLYYWQGNTKALTPMKISINPDASGVWPIPRTNCNFDNDDPTASTSNTCYEFRYTITGTTGVPSIDQLIPLGVFACTSANGSTGCDTSTIQGISPPGYGVSDVGPYGYLVDHEYAIRYTSNSALFSGLLSSGSVGITSFGIKIGKTNYGCGPIKGVAVPPTGFAQSTYAAFVTNVTEFGSTYCTSVDPATQCEFPVDCNPPNDPIPGTPIQNFNFGGTSSGTPILTVATPNSGCPKFFIKTKGPNTQYYCWGNPQNCIPIGP